MGQFAENLKVFLQYGDSFIGGAVFGVIVAKCCNTSTKEWKDLIAEHKKREKYLEQRNRALEKENKRLDAEKRKK